MSHQKRDEVIDKSMSDDRSFHLESYDRKLNEKEKNKIVTNNEIKELKQMDKSVKGLDIEFHPIVDIFPMMNTEEFENLKSDIEKHGLLEEIWTYDGKIIDGRNRYRACQELERKPKFKEWKPANGIELIDFVISMNLQRRHLTAGQKALVATSALPYYKQIAKKRQKLSKGRGKKGVAKMPQVFQGKSRDNAAKAVGVSGRYVDYAKQIVEKDPSLAKEVIDGKKTFTEARNQIKKDERIWKIRKNGLKYKPNKDIQNDIQIVCADFYQWCKDKLKDNSIDLILTEPPCTKKDLQLWEKLAEESARVLKPSSFIVAYCGHRYIDKVVHILSKHLNYYSLFCVDLNGNGKNFSQNNIIERWQPVLVYHKPPFRHDRISKEFLKDSGNNTNSQNNRMSENGFSYFLKMLSAQADVVLDPMMGKGEVLRVAKRLNRKFTGIGKDSDCIEIAKGILSE